MAGRFLPWVWIMCVNYAVAAQGNGLCEPLIRQYEMAHGIPPKLLTAISLVESGRKIGKTVVAWPWTINANGKPYVFTTKQEAIRAVRRLRLMGITSIDVGCMQVNLKQHPNAFKTLEEAFDPATNIAYAAKFLKTKKDNQGSWDHAVAHYHSATAKFHVPYKAKVLKTWSRVHKGSLPAETLTTHAVTEAEAITRHKGAFQETIDAPSGRRLPLMVRFAPYRGFKGRLPGAPQIIRGGHAKVLSKLILSSQEAVPPQRAFQIRGFVPTKTTLATLKSDTSPVKVTKVSLKKRQKKALRTQGRDPFKLKSRVK